MVLFFGLLMVTLLGFTALVTDAGLLYVERRHLQNSVDAAALAAARELLADNWSEFEVVEAASQWAAYNGIPASQLTEISIGTKTLAAGVLPTVTVRAERQVNLLFAFAFGVKQMPVSASAVAGVSPMQPLNIWPWAITESTYEELLAEQNKGNTVYLKVSSQGNQAGNFLPLRLGDGQGAPAYKDSIMNGFNGPLPVRVPPGPWVVMSETGNMSGPTEDAVEYLLKQAACSLSGNDIRCPLIGLIPVITDDSWEGAKGVSYPVHVVQMPVFQLTGLAQDPDAQGQGKGHQVVVGQFLEQGSGVGATDPDSTIDLFGVRLWE